MKCIERDITTLETGVLGHQVNCRKVMGAGVALAIRHKFPGVYECYRQKEEWKLGDCQIVQAGDKLYVANLAGQYNFGTDCQQTVYSALKNAIKEAYNFARSKNLDLYLPYKIGCGLAGGDWKIVVDIIDEVAPECILCKI